jgi:hypothetical protein
MRHLTWLAAVAGSAALVLAGTAAATAAPQNTAGGRAASVALRGGHTTVTTGKGLASALLANSIVPLAVSPGSESLAANLKAPAARLTFPVTGGRVGLKPLGGNVDHRGGILFVDTKTGKTVEVSNFIISLKHADLTGIVNGNPKARVVLLWLNLSHATLHVYRHWVVASNIKLTLSAGAASALNSALGTTLFSGGLALGSARTALRI